MRNSDIRQSTLFDLKKIDTPVPPNIERPFSLSGILLGTSSFTAAGWEGSFYPQGMRSRDFLSYYATQFQTVEIDSTFYGTPAASTVTNWNEKTPRDFIFAVKVPQSSRTRKSWWNQSSMSSSRECIYWATNSARCSCNFPSSTSGYPVSEGKKK
jgi:uncharacterized protein DUF72